jgi:hypothetical protein
MSAPYTGNLNELRGRDEFSDTEALHQELCAAYGDAEAAGLIRPSIEVNGAWNVARPPRF